jgi:hypothetical protein
MGEEMYKDSFCALFFKGKSTELYYEYISNTALCVFIIEQEALDEIKESIWTILFQLSVT